jgi:outer membrane immunogenic protein
MAPEVLNWTGFYIGANGGYSWGRSQSTASFFNTATGAPIAAPAGSVTGNDFNITGGVAGGQVGYNWQASNFVLGLEADLQWSGERGNSLFSCAATPLIGGVCVPGATFLPPGAAGTGVAIDQRLDWFGTVRGRGGLLVTPSVLAYVTGGLAYGSVRTDASLASFTAAGLATSGTSSSRQTHAGWTVGGGIEALFGSNWSGKLEYLYMDLGTFNSAIALATPPIGVTTSSRFTDNVFRAGINYHFSAGPVVARY